MAARRAALGRLDWRAAATAARRCLTGTRATRRAAGKEGCNDLEFPLDKKSILIGRDHSCDIRIVNKEISRKHAEVYVEDTGAVRGAARCAVGATALWQPRMHPVALWHGVDGGQGGSSTLQQQL